MPNGKPTNSNLSHPENFAGLPALIFHEWKESGAIQADGLPANESNKKWREIFNQGWFPMIDDDGKWFDGNVGKRVKRKDITYFCTKEENKEWIEYSANLLLWPASIEKKMDEKMDRAKLKDAVDKCNIECYPFERYGRFGFTVTYTPKK